MKSIKVYDEARLYHYTEEGPNFYILVDPNLPKNKERFVIVQGDIPLTEPYNGSIGWFELIFCDYLMVRKLPKIPKIKKPWPTTRSRKDIQYPRITSQYRPINDNYELTVDYLPKETATFYEILASILSKHQLKISSTTDENLLVSLREELPSINVIPKVTSKNVSSMFAKTYRSPEFAIFLRGRPNIASIPKVDQLQISTVNNELALAGANRNRWGVIQIKMAFPSMRIEDYKRLANDIEYTIMPEIYDRKVKIVRNKSDDPLFDKLSHLLDTGLSKDKIVTKYSDLIELGERFDLGEAYMLSIRLQWID